MSHIVIDARNITVSTGFYTQNLLKQLNDHYTKDDRYSVLVPSRVVSKWQKRLNNMVVIASNQPPYSIAEQASLVQQLISLKPDLVHFTMPQQPFLWIGPAVTTIHDLTLVHYDNIDMNRLVYKMRKGVFVSLLRTVVMRSKAIITPTRYTKNDLIQFMGGRFADKIHVTWEAGEITDARPEIIPALQNKQFILFVGNAFPYKNIGRIIEAFRTLKQTYPDLKLALAGKRDYFYGQHESFVKSLAIPDVHFLGFISDGQKRWALQHCEAYVTASLSEGFNIPTLEAMQEGAPLIASNASCHPEVIGDAALYFDPHSTEELVEHVRSVLDNPVVRTTLIKKGTARIKQFSWERMAEETVAVYRSVLSR